MVERLRALKATDLANVAKALGAKPSNCNLKTAEHIVEWLTSSAGDACRGTKHKACEGPETLNKQPKFMSSVGRSAWLWSCGAREVVSSGVDLQGRWLPHFPCRYPCGEIL